MKRTFQYKIKPVKPFGQTDQDEVVDFGFSGSITIQMPEFLERMKLAKEQQKLGDDIEKRSQAAIDICKKYISEMSVSHDDVDGAIESVEDLTIFEGGVSIIFDVYNQLLRGWQLSPKSVKP